MGRAAQLADGRRFVDEAAGPRVFGEVHHGPRHPPGLDGPLLPQGPHQDRAEEPKGPPGERFLEACLPPVPQQEGGAEEVDRLEGECGDGGLGLALDPGIEEGRVGVGSHRTHQEGGAGSGCGGEPRRLDGVLQVHPPEGRFAPGVPDGGAQAEEDDRGGPALHRLREGIEVHPHTFHRGARVPAVHRAPDGHPDPGVGVVVGEKLHQVAPHQPGASEDGDPVRQAHGRPVPRCLPPTDPLPRPDWPWTVPRRPRRARSGS